MSSDKNNHCIIAFCVCQTRAHRGTLPIPRIRMVAVPRKAINVSLSWIFFYSSHITISSKFGSEPLRCSNPILI